MAETTAQAKSARQQGNWRHRENRASPKIVMKRVSQADHAALTRYAEDHGTNIAELLTPHVQELLELAHQYCDQVEAHASA